MDTLLKACATLRWRLIFAAALASLPFVTNAAASPSAAPLRLAMVSEESLPAAELPSASPSAGLSPSAVATPSDSDDSGDSAAKAGASDDADTSDDADDTDDSANDDDDDGAATPAVAPTATPGSPNASAATASPDALAGSTPSAQVSPAGPPPALDVSTLNGSADLGAASLAPEIKKASSPALAASIRLTEQARKKLASGAIDDAVRDLGRAVSIDPDDPFAYYYLGRAYVVRRNYAQARTFFQRAELGFAARPEWLGETLGYEGACDEELAQTPDAAKAYQRAVAAAPQNFRAQAGYGRLGPAVVPVTNTAIPPPPDYTIAPLPPVTDPAPPPAAKPAAASPD